MRILSKAQRSFLNKFVHSAEPTESEAQQVWVSAQASPKAKPAAPPAPPRRTIKGADFSDEKAMKGIAEKYGEIAFAQMKVITDSGQSSKYAAQQKVLSPAGNKITGANVDRKAAYASRDFAKVDAQLKVMEALIDDVLKAARELRDIYRADHQETVRAERDATGAVTTSDTMHAVMLDEFYEMAHIGSLMAKEFNDKKENKKKQLPLDKMELGEVAAIYGYSTQDYTKINARLRGPGDGESEVDGYIEATVKGLDKLPRFKGSVIRCDDSAQYFFDEVVRTGKRTEKAFMSTGLKKVPGFGDVETFIKKVKTGKEITGFSLHQGEGEVLFPPNSVFEFVSFTADDGTKIKRVADLAAAYPNGAAITKGKFEFKQIS